MPMSFLPTSRLGTWLSLGIPEKSQSGPWLAPHSLQAGSEPRRPGSPRCGQAHAVNPTACEFLQAGLPREAASALAPWRPH